nr:unnamed protein product [Digitaria exilis]
MDDDTELVPQEEEVAAPAGSSTGCWDDDAAHCVEASVVTAEASDMPTVTMLTASHAPFSFSSPELASPPPDMN